MAQPSLAVIQKAQRLVDEDAITVTMRDPQGRIMAAIVQGDTGVYTVHRNVKGWRCDCPVRGAVQCSHRAAVQHLAALDVSPPADVPAPPPPQAQKGERPMAALAPGQFEIKQATKATTWARIALIGPSGSGKTYTALEIARGLLPNRKPVVIDTERGSANKFADRHDFDQLEMETFSPDTYAQAITYCEGQGYRIIIIDSLSHAWMGRDGALQQVDEAMVRYKNNKFAAWGEVTPKHVELIETMLRVRAHLIVTMRVKMEYVLETNSQGKQVPRRIGLAPVQREGMEYEFDVIGELDQEHNLVIGKSRYVSLADRVFRKPTSEVGTLIREECLAGTRPAPAPTPTGENDTDGSEQKQASPEAEAPPTETDLEQDEAREPGAAEAPLAETPEGPVELPPDGEIDFDAPGAPGAGQIVGRVDETPARDDPLAAAQYQQDGTPANPEAQLHAEILAMLELARDLINTGSLEPGVADIIRSGSTTRGWLLRQHLMMAEQEEIRLQWCGFTEPWKELTPPQCWVLMERAKEYMSRKAAAQ